METGPFSFFLRCQVNFSTGHSFEIPRNKLQLDIPGDTTALVVSGTQGRQQEHAFNPPAGYL